MSDNFDLCSWERVEVQTSDGVCGVQAWRYGELAAHQIIGGGKRWTITHLPSGLSFASLGYFPSGDEAVAAMVEVVLLRNTWRHADIDDLKKHVPDIKAIFDRHGALPTKKGHVGTYRSDMNDGHAA